MTKKRVKGKKESNHKMNEKLTKMKKFSGASQKRNGRRRKDSNSKKLDKKTVRCQRKNKMEGNISLSELKHGKKKNPTLR